MSKRPVSQFGAPSTSRSSVGGGHDGYLDTTSVVQLIEALHNYETREQALLLLSKNRVEDLGPLLWHSVGTIATLVQEIVSTYRALYSSTLTDRASMRVCNALALLQCVATHPETKLQFIKANIPMYLYPFLNNPNTEKPHEYLRLTSLGVIGALVKVDDTQVVRFLLESQIFPSCLRCMEIGSDLSKTVATFIVHKILLNNEGLKYCCVIAERFYAIGSVLEKMIEKLAEEGKLAEDSSKRLLKHIIWCYHRLSENPRACNGLRNTLPQKLRDANFVGVLRDDLTAMQCLQQLLQNIATACGATTRPVEQLLRHLVRT